MIGAALGAQTTLAFESLCREAHLRPLFIERVEALEVLDLRDNHFSRHQVEDLANRVPLTLLWNA